MSFGVDPRNPTEYARINYFLMPCVNIPRQPVSGLGGDYNFQLNTVWRVGENPATGNEGDQWILTKKTGSITSGFNPTWVLFTSSVGDLLSLSDNNGTKAYPDSDGNIQLTQGTYSRTVAGASLINISSMAEPTWIVDPTAGSGTHQTITAAMASANAGDTILVRPNANPYVEDFTAKAGVSLIALAGSQDTPNVTIRGKISYSAAGMFTIANIRLETNNDFFLDLGGSSAAMVYLEECYFNMTNHTGISYSTSSASSMLFSYNCKAAIRTTGITLYTSSSPGNLILEKTVGVNPGGSTTISSNSAGVAFIRYSIFGFPISNTGTGSTAVQFSFIDTHAQNVTAFTCNGVTASSSSSYQSNYFSGSAVAISVGSSLLSASDVVNSSSSTYAVTGSGILQYSGISFANTNYLFDPALTLIRRAIDGGEYKGKTSSTAPSTGMLGEQIRASVATASAITLTTSTPANVTSISLTPGIWDVSAIGSFNGAVTGTNFSVSISTVSATVGTPGDNAVNTPTAPTADADYSLSIPAYRITVASNTTTTCYLVVSAVFTLGTCKAYGRISATRVA